MFQRFMAYLLLLTTTLSPLQAQAQDFNWAPDFPVGSSIPLLNAPDQHGVLQDLASLTGDKGLVLFFNRSFDWCPFCKAQLVDLNTQQANFIDRGYQLATLTYDPVATLAQVAEDQEIDFPLLHDEAVSHVNAYHILNTDYAPDHFAYGVPQPGIMIISPSGVILAKFAEESFRDRPDLSWVLEQLDAL